MAEFINEIGETIVITVANDGIGTGAVVVAMDGPHSRGEWTITRREASELRRALADYLSEAEVAEARSATAHDALSSTQNEIDT